MWQSVIEAFPLRFSAPLEGMTHNAYLDIKGLVTVGIGCLIDPIANGLPLPWVMPDGSVAPASVIEEQLSALKQRQELKSWSAGSKPVLGATTIRLTDEGVVELAVKRLLQNELYMRKTFGKPWETWPADAQLFACSMAWAVGAGWPGIFGNCTRLLLETPPQFGLCAVGAPNARPEDATAPCDIRVGTNYGIVPRNAQNRLLLTNAQVVIDRGLEPSVLHWPKSPLNDTEPAPPPSGSA
jgi:hypothetical protein